MSTQNEALHRAISASDIDAARGALANGADVNAFSPHGAPSLVLAAYRGSVEMIRLLLEQGADIELRTTGWDRSSALDTAVVWDHFDAVRTLLDAGAVVDAVAENGTTALMLAALEPDHRIALLLLERGANVNLRDLSGRSAWDIASEKTMDDMAALLAEHGAETE